MSLDSLVTWAAHFGAGERAELICAEAPEPERGHRAWKAVRAPGCVADLEPHTIVELFALGVDEVAVRTRGCAHPDRLGETLARWGTLLGLAGRDLTDAPTGRRRRPVLQAANMPTVERRSLFGLGRKSPRPDDAWTPDTSSTDHQRLRAALRQLGARPTEAGEAEGLGLRILADGCESQGQCVQACPQDALQLVHTALGTGDQRTELTFDASLCNACGRCIDYCDRDALTGPVATTFNDLVDAAATTIATVTTRRCVRCRAAFVPDGVATLCPVCAERRANPFGSTLPPEAIERLKRMRNDSPAT